jgi:hypothetical protein
MRPKSPSNLSKRVAGFKHEHEQANQSADPTLFVHKLADRPNGILDDDLLWMRIGCNSKINSRQFNQNLKCAYE